MQLLAKATHASQSQPCSAGRDLSPDPRQGLTILEVLLALAIFLGAMISLGQLISTGSQASSRSQLQTEAVFRAESKLAEIIAGIEPMQASGPNPFMDDPTEQWSWTLELLESPHVDLLALSLTVTHVNNVERVNATHNLVRLVRDPQIYLDAALDAEATAAESGGS